MERVGVPMRGFSPPPGVRGYFGRVPEPRPAPPPEKKLNLDAGQFTPISSAEAKEKVKGMGSLFRNPWFGRRDLIPPVSDERTQLIDRAMVGLGMITPEQLVEIHEVGQQMEKVRPDLAQAAVAADDAVEMDAEEREDRKAQKQAEAEERKKRRAEDIARRRETDIVFLGRGVSGGLADRYGPGPLIAGGAGLVAVAFAGLALTAPFENLWFGVLPLMTLMGIGMGFVVTPLSTAVMTSVADSDTGTASGVNNAVARVAGLLAVALMGSVAAFVFAQVTGQAGADLSFGRPAAPGSLSRPVEELRVAATNAAAPGGQFVVGAGALPGNPYDSHTVAAQIAQTERITGVAAERAYVDRGYRGHDADRTRVFISRQKRGLTPTIRRELRRRNAVEPVIGHMKADGLLNRTVYAENVLRVEYEISEAARGLKPVFQALFAWSERYGPLSRQRRDEAGDGRPGEELAA